MVHVCQRLVKRVFLILFLLQFFVTTRTIAQCSCSDCPVILPPVGSNSAHLTIAGATNNVLDGVNQFVRVIHITVLHDALRECEFRLIAPDGSSILLSDNSGVNVGNNITYDICFIDCTGMAIPDPGFPANFDAAAGYMHDETYYGTYYPFDGSCLSVLTGPVNGEWTLAFEDFVGGDGGEIIDWSIEFNDSSGTGCSVNCDPPPPPCGAVEDTLVIPDLASFCLGSPDLQFNIVPFYDPPLADPSLYGFVFLLTDLATGATIEYNTDQDYTDLPLGDYKVCGVTYLLTDEPLLPPLDGTDLYFVIKDMIANDIICASVSKDCFVFSIVPPPTPFDVIGPTVIQSGEEGIYTILNFEAGVTTTVYVPSGCYTNFSVNLDIIKITWLGGPGEICVLKTNACGSETACIEVDVIVDPLLFTIEGPNLLCGGEQANYTVTPSINTAEFDYEWVVVNGGIQSESNDGLSVIWNPGTTGEICLIITDVCGGEHEFCYEVEILDVQADPPLMSNFPQIVCLQTELDANLTVSPGYLDIIWTVNGGDLLTGQGSTEVTFTSNIEGVVIICADVYYECDIQYQVCNSVQYIARPNPVIQILQSCGLFAEVRVSNPLNGSSFNWEKISGPGDLIFDQGQTFRTTFTGTLPGTYTIAITETIGECTGSKNLTFDLEPNLLVEEVEVDCSDINGYTVTFTLSGGATPYFVDATQLAGNTFVSGLIPHDQDYNFLVQDNASCILNVSGMSKCDCFTDAGTSGENLITVCEGEKAVGEVVTDAILDPDDIGLYILQSSNNQILGIIYQTNTIPEFEFLPPLEYGKTYYISYIAGNDLGGNIDFTDECLSVSHGQPVVFIETPKPELSPPLPVCGLTTEVTVTNYTNGHYYINAADPGVSADSIAPGVFRITASDYGDFSLTLFAENQGCTGQRDFNARFFKAPSAEASDFQCSQDLSVFSVLLTLEGNGPFQFAGQTVTAIDDTHVRIENLPSGAITDILITDVNGCTSWISVEYNCQCQSTPGTMSSSPLKACGDEGVQAVYLQNGNPGNVDSFIYILHTLSGNVLGTILQTSPDGYFVKSANESFNTVYYISYVTVNFVNGQYELDPCSFITPGQPVSFIEIPVILWDVTIENCTPEANFVLSSNGVLQNLNMDQSPSGSTISGLNNQGFISDLPGQYVLSVEADNQGCGATASQTVTLFNAPVVADVVPDCDGLFFETTISFSQGTPPYLLNGTTPITSPYTSPLSNSGDIFSFYVEDSRGCKTEIFESTLNCNCIADVGTLSGAGFVLCENSDFSPSFTPDYILDTGYEIQYILHDGSSSAIGTIYWRGTQFPVPYQASFAGKNLVITRVIGPVLPDGSIDLSDDCAGVSNSIPVRWTQKPVIDIVLDPFYCEGSDIVIALANVPAGTLELTYENGQMVEVIQGLNDVILDPDLVKTGDVIQWQFTDEFGCQYNLDNTILTIIDKPSAGITDADFGNCIDQSETISLFDFISNEDSDGTWYLGGFTQTINSELLVGPAIQNTTTAYYLVDNECGTDTASVLIERWPLPDFQTTGIDPLCFGELNGSITIEPQGSSDQWDIFVNNEEIDDLEINNLAAGNYEIRAVNSFGCAQQKLVLIEEPDQLELNLGGDITIEEGESISVTALVNVSLNDIQSAIWTLPWGEVIDGKDLNISLVPDQEGVIRLVITDINGCVVENQINLRINKKEVVIVINIPNIFKPGNGSNGSFSIPDHQQILRVETCKIYDRWGNLVYSLENAPPNELSWNGEFNGKEVQQGVYVYTMLLHLTDGSVKSFVGDLTILR